MKHHGARMTRRAWFRRNMVVVLLSIHFKLQRSGCEALSSTRSSLLSSCCLKEARHCLFAATPPAAASDSTSTTTNRFELEDEHQEYSRSLSPRQTSQQMEQENVVALYDEEGPKWRQRLIRPFKAIYRNLRRNPPQPGTLILIKSGESFGKQQGVFTGWANPKLTAQGEQECQHAARLLLEAGYEPDLVYTSMLDRAMHSVWIINQEMNAIFLPCLKSWRLNERMYGSIQGLNKRETAVRFGQDMVQAWRRSFKARPPPLSKLDPAHPCHDRRYATVDPELLPESESLLDCMKRQQPLWTYKIKPQLQKGNHVLVVAHSNSLRGLVKLIDNISERRIEEVAFPPGIPVVYKFDGDMHPMAPPPPAATDDTVSSSLRQEHTSGTFLEKPGRLEKALAQQTAWQTAVPGTAGVELAGKVKRLTTLEESLLLLKQERERVLPGEEVVEDDGSEFEEPTRSMVTSSSLSMILPSVGQLYGNQDPVVVFVRHGTTPHNQLSLFTGWEDPPLAETGVEDAKRAGRLLKRHGFEFDVVYTSWLGRAIETAWYILDELDMQWLPLVKSWRLNERHYGALTGKSKKMVGNMYGQDQLKKWRRSFDIPPPKASSYSFTYPGNDRRRTKYVKDLRISFTESFCRSIEARQIQIHRKFPKSESLKTCMERSIPFYTQKIVPEAVAKGKRVLITSHENAIRGILMHLCEIPPEHMNDLYLPNGLPLVYNVRRKCISLLDDGTGRDPMDLYDFGSAAQYLFRSCELEKD